MDLVFKESMCMFCNFSNELECCWESGTCNEGQGIQGHTRSHPPPPDLLNTVDEYHGLGSKVYTLMSSGIPLVNTNHTLGLLEFGRL